MKIGNPRIQTFLKGHFPGCSVAYSIVFPLSRTSYDLTQKIRHTTGLAPPGARGMAPPPIYFSIKVGL